MTLSETTVAVTGAGAGIGRAIALAMARAGARVACIDIDGEAAEATAGAVHDLGATSLAVAADVGDVAGIERMIAGVESGLGELEVLVNNAGVTVRKLIMDITEEDWDRIHRVNARGVFFCLQRAAAVMIPRRRGRIINIASIAGRGFAGTSNAAYAASKGAVISLTRTAAQQLGGYNINVNAVCPGVTRTPLLERSMARRAEMQGTSLADAEAGVVAGIPIGRLNEPDDVAGVTVFLASPAARNVTGQAWNVDGGIITS